MQKNVFEDCNFDNATRTCEAPVGLKNIKGAILYGSNAGSPGYRPKDQDLIEGAVRTENSSVISTDSSALPGIAKWPAVQIVKEAGTMSKRWRGHSKAIGERSA